MSSRGMTQAQFEARRRELERQQEESRRKKSSNKPLLSHSLSNKHSERLLQVELPHGCKKKSVKSWLQ